MVNIEYNSIFFYSFSEYNTRYGNEKEYCAFLTYYISIQSLYFYSKLLRAAIKQRNINSMQ